MSAQQGGQTRQAQIRAVLGAQGYRRYQQALGQAGGRARQARLRETLGTAGYTRRQRTLAQRAVQHHGPAMRAILATIHERRRCWRIANPTPAEELLHWLALQAGLTLFADLTGDFAWTRYLAEPECWPFTPTDAVIEARVLGYACDLLLPTHAIVIEVHGGVHALTPERDAARTAALHAQGLTVITLSNEQLFAGTADHLFDELLEAHHRA